MPPNIGGIWYTCDMEHLSEKKRFSIIARAKSIKHAVRGVSIIFRTQHNAWVHAVVGVVVVVLGFVLRISHLEWGLIILAITSVVAAGAVLLTAVGAIFVGILVFLPKAVRLWN